MLFSNAVLLGGMLKTMWAKLIIGIFRKTWSDPERESIHPILDRAALLSTNLDGFISPQKH